MSVRTATREVRVLNPEGLHARPASVFAKVAMQFEATIEVIKDDQPADGKSVLDLLMLAAEEGTVLTIRARGHDCHQAVQTLGELMEDVVEFQASAGSKQDT
jgi:phosphotransferase system HPr (HPr) family protein